MEYELLFSSHGFNQTCPAASAYAGMVPSWAVDEAAREKLLTLPVNTFVIILSDQLPMHLTQEELRAVILHEQGHMVNGDIEAAHKGLPLKPYIDRELAADEYAASYINPRILHSALRKSIAFAAAASARQDGTSEYTELRDALKRERKRLRALRATF